MNAHQLGDIPDLAAQIQAIAELLTARHDSIGMVGVTLHRLASEILEAAGEGEA